VFKPPLSDQTTYSPADSLVFDLVVIGSAVDHLPYFIVAFRELGAMGFGLNRAKVRLDRVEAITPSGPPAVVYDAGSNMVRPAPPLDLPVTESAGETLAPARATVGELTLTSLTPTTLKAGSDVGHEGEIVRRPSFHHVVKRLRDRVNALATFHGSGPLVSLRVAGTTRTKREGSYVSSLRPLPAAGHRSWRSRIAAVVPMRRELNDAPPPAAS
jgi:hypothetical protein